MQYFTLYQVENVSTSLAKMTCTVYIPYMIAYTVVSHPYAHLGYKHPLHFYFFFYLFFSLWYFCMKCKDTHSSDITLIMKCIPWLCIIKNYCTMTNKVKKYIIITNVAWKIMFKWHYRRNCDKRFRKRIPQRNNRGEERMVVCFGTSKGLNKGNLTA